MSFFRRLRPKKSTRELIDLFEGSVMTTALAMLNALQKAALMDNNIACLWYVVGSRSFDFFYTIFINLPYEKEALEMYAQLLDAEEDLKQSIVDKNKIQCIERECQNDNRNILDLVNLFQNFETLNENEQLKALIVLKHRLNEKRFNQKKRVWYLNSAIRVVSPLVVVTSAVCAVIFALAAGSIFSLPILFFGSLIGLRDIYRSYKNYRECSTKLREIEKKRYCIEDKIRTLESKFWKEFSSPCSFGDQTSQETCNTNQKTPEETPETIQKEISLLRQTNQFLKRTRSKLMEEKKASRNQAFESGLVFGLIAGLTVLTSVALFATAPIGIPIAITVCTVALVGVCIQRNWDKIKRFGRKCRSLFEEKKYQKVPDSEPDDENQSEPGISSEALSTDSDLSSSSSKESLDSVDQKTKKSSSVMQRPAETKASIFAKNFVSFFKKHKNSDDSLDAIGVPDSAAETTMNTYVKVSGRMF